MNTVPTETSTKPPSRLGPLVRLGPEHVGLVVTLVVLIVASWGYLVWMAGAMNAGMDSAMAPAPTAPTAWTLPYLGMMVMMWWIMMLGMMLPSALPMILFFARISASQREKGQPRTSPALFVAAYAVLWAGFSVVATGAQWGLERAGWLSSMGDSTNYVWSGTLFVAAGVYQLTPLKTLCLRYCRSPLTFLLQHWRDGAAGAVRLGAIHGVYCLGCCWVLMALLFAIGVMNLAWVVALTAIVLAEKVVPRGDLLAKVSGPVLIAIGLGMLIYA